MWKQADRKIGNELMRFEYYGENSNKLFALITISKVKPNTPGEMYEMEIELPDVPLNESYFRKTIDETQRLLGVCRTKIEKLEREYGRYEEDFDLLVEDFVCELDEA